MEPIFVFSGIAFFTYEYNNNYALTSGAAFNVAWLYNWLKYKFNTKIKPCYTSVYQCSPKEFFRIEYIKDGRPIRTIIFTEDEEEELQNLATQISNYNKRPNEYDFILYKINENYKSSDTNEKTLIRYDEIPNTFEYIKSNANFLSMEIKYNEISYAVNKDLGNFYVANNIICDKHFAKWYMKQRYNINITGEYQITYMNEEFEVNTIDHNDHILLTDSSYNINGTILDENDSVDDETSPTNEVIDENDQTEEDTSEQPTAETPEDDMVQINNEETTNVDSSGNYWYWGKMW